MAVRPETYREASVQVFRDRGIKPRIIRVSSQPNSKPEGISVINYEFTMDGTYFRVPGVTVAFDEDINGPLFDENVSAQIDEALLKIKLRQDKQRIDGLTRIVS